MTNLKRKKIREKESKKVKKPELSFISLTNPTHVLKFHGDRNTLYLIPRPLSLGKFQ